LSEQPKRKKSKKRKAGTGRQLADPIVDSRKF
jgi:hypothetical protein